MQELVNKDVVNSKENLHQIYLRVLWRLYIFAAIEKSYNKKIDMINAKKAAEILGVAVQTIYKYAYKGQIPSYRICGNIRFKAEELEEWVESQKLTPEIDHVPNAAL